MPIVARQVLADRVGATDCIRCLVDLDAPCNLRCPGCPRTSRGRLLEDVTASALSARIAEQVVASGRKHAHVVFYGGEPLVAAEQFLGQLWELGGQLGRAKVAHRFALVTNGTLLKRNLTVRLAEAGVSRVLVTLCGCRAHHDLRRTTTSGGPTYDRILANLAEARRHLHVRIRYEIHDHACLACIPVLMADLLSRDLLAGPRCLQMTVQGPSSYADQARTLADLDWPAEPTDAHVHDLDRSRGPI